MEQGTMNWKGIRDELVHSLQEWGVNKEHVKFRTKVISDGKEMVHHRYQDGEAPSYEHLKSQRFPTNLDDAVELVLRSDIESNSLEAKFGCIDTIPVDSYEPSPFYRRQRHNFITSANQNLRATQ
jgi:hypothetical protein